MDGGDKERGEEGEEGEEEERKRRIRRVDLGVQTSMLEMCRGRNVIDKCCFNHRRLSTEFWLDVFLFSLTRDWYDNGIVQVHG